MHGTSLSLLSNNFETLKFFNPNNQKKILDHMKFTMSDLYKKQKKYGFYNYIRLKEQNISERVYHILYLNDLLPKNENILIRYC